MGKVFFEKHSPLLFTQKVNTRGTVRNDHYLFGDGRFVPYAGIKGGCAKPP